MEDARSALELENPDSHKKTCYLVRRTSCRWGKEWAQVLRLSFWKVPERFERLDYAVAFTPTNGSCLVLEEIDVCLSFLLGSWKDDWEPCLVPQKCSRLMTQTHCSDYSLSHQIFNFLFAEMKRCRNPLFLNARFYRNVLCRLMMQENLHPQKNALLNATGDLFTENIMFCGLAGFSNFYKPEWLDRILSWQLPEKGCFWMYGEWARYLGCIHKIVESEGTSWGHLVQPFAQRSISSGCSSHNTAVAVAAIGGFLYYGF
ncbi:UPF0764 protein C16orf89 homolog [Anolis sagrei]|uniref:UPF0764 protein C16orf89 homolog n=1 Tax=Anolis sagrei TaxID=38937 RepID=UPI0035204880